MEFNIIENIKEHLLHKWELIYTGRISVVEGDENFYSISIDLNKELRPLIIAGEFESDKLFAAHVNKELDKRQVFKTEYYTIEMKLSEQDIRQQEKAREHDNYI